MRLTSSDFANKGKLPRACTCEGDDLSPALTGGEAPPQARGFALICSDPDAQVGVCPHWSAYDNPAAVAGLARGEGCATQEKFKQAINFRRAGHGGPCPPRGPGAHRYRFRLLALSVGRLPAGKGARCRDVEREAQKHMLAEVELVGTFER